MLRSHVPSVFYFYQWWKYDGSSRGSAAQSKQYLLVFSAALPGFFCGRRRVVLAATEKTYKSVPQGMFFLLATARKLTKYASYWKKL